MKVLAIDTALARCSVAAWADGIVLAAESRDLPRGHAEALLPMIARVTAAAGLVPAGFDRIAVTVGPGHFTGLRAGLAAARGLALATGRGLVGLTTLAVVAAGVPAAAWPAPRLLVALDSKRAEPFLQLFGAGGVALGPPLSHPLPGLAAFLGLAGPVGVAGDAAAAVAAALAAAGVEARVVAADPLPDAAVLAALGAAAVLPAAAPGPLYLHPPAVRLPA